MAVLVGKSASADYLTANCKPSDSVGDCVYILSDKVGQNYQVTKVDIDSGAPEAKIAIGILKSKSASNVCIVHLLSKLTGVFTGMTPGRLLYVGIDSKPTETAPLPPVTGTRVLQVIGYSISSTELFVNPGDPETLVPVGSIPTLDNFKRNIVLTGTKDGVNLTFNTMPDKFVRTPFKEVVYRNGVTQEAGAASDYIASESGGVGTGYDIITLMHAATAPLSWEKLAIDYLKQVP